MLLRSDSQPWKTAAESLRGSYRRRVTTDRVRPILLKNSVRELERATLRKPTSQIDPGSTIATSAR